MAIEWVQFELWAGDKRSGSRGHGGGGTRAIGLELTWLGGRRAVGLERTWFECEAIGLERSWWRHETSDRAREDMVEVGHERLRSN